MFQIFTYGENYAELFERVPKELWPIEYGGEAGSIDEITDALVKKVQEYRQFFENDMKYGIKQNQQEGSSAKDDLIKFI